jgi:cell division inhibitor SulA/protein ImuA
MNAALSQLLHHPWFWRGDDLAFVASTLPTGYEALDRELPGGGWPHGQLIELLADDHGIGELRLLLPALRALVESGGWVAMVAPPHTPYAPAFARAGIDPRRIIVIETSDHDDRQHWWAAEQVLRANAAAALLFWPRRVPDARLRRLHLAAQEGDAPAFLFSDMARARQTSPSPLRIRLAAADGSMSTRTSLALDIFKRRGGLMHEPLKIVLAIDSFAAKPVESPSPDPPCLRLRCIHWNPRHAHRRRQSPPPSAASHPCRCDGHRASCAGTRSMRRRRISGSAR